MIYLKAQVVCDTDDCGNTTDVLVRNIEHTTNGEYHYPELLNHPDGWLIDKNHVYCPDCCDRHNHGK